MKRLFCKLFEIIIISLIIGASSLLLVHAQTIDDSYCIPPGNTTSSIYWYIQCVSPIYGVDSHMAEFIAEKESALDPTRVGDYGTSFGLFQIHLPAHRDITKQQALDPVFSTNWALQQMALGNENIWTTWSERCAWYKQYCDITLR